MDKIKNIISSNKDGTVDNTAQNTGTATGQTGALSGEGSHLAGANNTIPSEQVAGTYPIESGVVHPQKPVETSGLTAGQGSIPGQTTGFTRAGVGNTQTSGTSDFAGTDNMNTTASSHPTGSAAIGAGGVGLAEHEQNQNNHGVLSRPHQSNMMNKLDPQVNTNQTTASGAPMAANPAVTSASNPDTQTSSHLGRDAGIAGGAGVAGYEADRLGHKKTDSAIAGVTTTDHPAHTFEQPRDMHQNVHDTQTTQAIDPGQTQDHHWGRDATMAAGGFGGAASEAENHHHGKGQTTAEHEQKEEHRHDHKGGKLGGILSFLHRDKNKKYTKEEEAEFDRQEREHNASHAGRDVALGGAAAGGLYEAEKHHNNHHNASTTVPGSNVAGTGEGTHNTHAGGHGITHGVPLVEKPLGTDIGDKLHGIERNRGVVGGSGFVDEFHRGPVETTDQHHHVGRDAALGAGAHATAAPSGQHQHHLGRDAALGGAAVGVGEHEHHKHEGIPATSQNLPPSQVGVGAVTGAGTSTGPAPNTSGPHSSDWMNKLDPRADSKAIPPPAIAPDEYRKTDASTGERLAMEQQMAPGMGMGEPHVGAAGTGTLHHTGPTIGDDRTGLTKGPPV